MKITIGFLIGMTCFLKSYGQNTVNNIFDAGIEFQAYPTGLIPGVRLEKGFASHHAAHLRLGYNWIRHGSLGKHDDERGDGYGFTLGYKYYFRPAFKGFFAGIRNDIWWNEIQWKNQLNSIMEEEGTTKITVVQPTVEAGWLFPLGESWQFAPSLAFGYEVNVKTEGSPTGEGAILLVGVVLGKRWR